MIVAACLICGCAHTDQLSKSEIIAIARRYASSHPTKNALSNRAPEASILHNIKAAKGESIWIVTFETPAQKDKTGKTMGPRPYWGLSVYLKRDGTVLNISLHTP